MSNSVHIFDTKQRRAYQSILSGLMFAKYGQKDVRFLTLNTSDEMVNSENFNKHTLNNNFQMLRKRILRTSPDDLYDNGYVTKTKQTQKYGDEIEKKFIFEYFKVQTNEGNGVLHILFRGQYIPYNWLVDNWQDIHNSWNISISYVDLNNIKKAGAYVVSQYVGGQGTTYIRSSQSRKWVFKGYKDMWYNIRSAHPQKCIKLWHDILKNKANSYFWMQKELDEIVKYEDENIKKLSKEYRYIENKENNIIFLYVINDRILRGWR